MRREPCLASRRAQPASGLGSTACTRRYDRRPSRSGGTGRRAGLKIPCPSGRVGSTPTSGIVPEARDRPALRRRRHVGPLRRSARARLPTLRRGEPRAGTLLPCMRAVARRRNAGRRGAEGRLGALRRPRRVHQPSDRADPEDVRATLRPYHERVKREIERFGGTVEKFIGDAVMAVFGAPVAHEDDAERAVRSALRILDTIEELRAEGLELAVRAAVDDRRGRRRARRPPGARRGHRHGRRRQHRRASPVGSCRSARVIVDETTRRSTEGVIDVRAARRRLRRRARPSRSPSGARRRAEPLRRQPEAATRDAVRRTGARARAPASTRSHGAERDRPSSSSRSSASRVIGKSRLVTELRTALDDRPDLVTWRQGRCLPVRRGHHVLGARRDREGRGRDPRVGRPEEARGQARDSAVADRRGRTGARVVRDASRRRSSASGDDGRRQPRGVVHGLAELPRGDGGTSMRARRRGPPLGRSSAARFLEHLGTGRAGAASPPVHGPARAVRATTGLGRWEAQRDHDNAVATIREETGRLTAGPARPQVLPAETQAALLERAGGNPLYASSSRACSLSAAT